MYPWRLILNGTLGINLVELRYKLLVGDIWLGSFNWIMELKVRWLIIKGLEKQVVWRTNEWTIHLRHLAMKEERVLRKLSGEEESQWTGACLYKKCDKISILSKTGRYEIENVMHVCSGRQNFRTKRLLSLKCLIENW